MGEHTIALLGIFSTGNREAFAVAEGNTGFIGHLVIRLGGTSEDAAVIVVSTASSVRPAFAG